MTFLIAGTIKGAVGIGLPTASVGILTQSVDPRTAIALVVFPIMASNAWQVMRAGRLLACLKEYWIFAVALMSVLWLTTYVTGQVSESALIAVIGSVVVIFALTSLLFRPPAFPIRYDKFFQAGFGATAGIIGGLTALWAPPLVVYLTARRVERDEFMRATGLLIFLGSLPLCIGFWREGLLTGPLALTSAAMTIPSLAGFSLGEVIRRRLPAENFRTAVLVIFLLMGLNLVRRAVV